MTTKIDLKAVKKPYFLGIGGIGISAIARMFLLEGKTVHGSDLSDSEVVAELRRSGAVVDVGPTADFVAEDFDLIVYTIAIEVAQPKLITELRKRRVPLVSYPEMLGLISKDKFTIAVAGTHGKTTTTAMIGKMLVDAGMSPTVIVGSFIKDNFGNRTNFVAGTSKYFVVEACEYRRSFLNIRPTIAVITNIDNDHLDYYKDIPDIAKAFREFIGSMSRTGYVVTDAKNKNVKLATKNVTPKVVDFAAFRESGLKLKVPGAHNKENAAAALAVSHLLGIDKKKALRSLETFAGTWRRFEYKGNTATGAVVYDDYGHHPTEIKATLAGARELYPKARLVVAFQPHLYSRTKLLLNDFAHAFRAADEVVLAPIYPAREAPDPAISSELLAARLNAAGTKALSFRSLAEVEKRLSETLGKGDVLLTLGAGETNKIAAALVGK